MKKQRHLLTLTLTTKTSCYVAIVSTMGKFNGAINKVEKVMPKKPASEAVRKYAEIILFLFSQVSAVSLYVCKIDHIHMPASNASHRTDRIQLVINVALRGFAAHKKNP